MQRSCTIETMAKDNVREKEKDVRVKLITCQPQPDFTPMSSTVSHRPWKLFYEMVKACIVKRAIFHCYWGPPHGEGRSATMTLKFGTPQKQIRSP